MMTRRGFIKGGTAVLPLTALAGSATGIAQSSGPQRIPVVTMRYADLHPSLEGLRILHLSDLHLGADMRASDLEALLLRAKAARPHLTLVTGDVADDLEELEAALGLLAKHAPSLGVYASLGNHEYLHDISKTRPIYERSAVPLLVDSGTTLRVGGAKLYLGGANDPVSIAPDISAFMESTVKERCPRPRRTPSDCFSVIAPTASCLPQSAASISPCRDTPTACRSVSSVEARSSPCIQSASCGESIYGEKAGSIRRQALDTGFHFA